jgi:hypothetical protein
MSVTHLKRNALNIWQNVVYYFRIYQLINVKILNETLQPKAKEYGSKFQFHFVFLSVHFVQYRIVIVSFLSGITVAYCP